MRLALWIILIFSAPSNAAHTTFEAFDIKSCEHWVFDDDPGYYGDPDIPAAKRYNKAIAIADRAEKTLKSRDSGYVSTYKSIRIGFKDFNEEVRFGPAINSDSTVTFLTGVDFPLAGAKYKQTRRIGELATFKCIRGCSKAPIVIFDMGYETMDQWSNFEYDGARKKFNRKCGRNP